MISLGSDRMPGGFEFHPGADGFQSLGVVRKPDGSFLFEVEPETFHGIGGTGLQGFAFVGGDHATDSAQMLVGGERRD